jgi:hypothetical protein
MQLVNFRSESSKLTELVNKISGTYPELDFSSHWQNLDVGRILETDGIDIEPTELKNNPVDGTFIYENRRVLVYIRDQRGSYYQGELSVSDYRFHIVNCKTIQEFKNKGKFNRYVVSTRTDNLFACNIIIGQNDPQNRYNEFRELKVCKNCLDQLCYLNFCNKPKFDKTELHDSFNLLDYFNKYNNTFVSKPRFTDINQPIGIYPENWPDISRKIRIKYNWICQDCKVDYSNKKAFLDTHHIDSNPGNCEDSNLKPLCKTCHRKVHRK